MLESTIGVLVILFKKEKNGATFRTKSCQIMYNGVTYRLPTDSSVRRLHRLDTILFAMKEFNENQVPASDSKENRGRICACE